MYVFDSVAKTQLTDSHLGLPYRKVTTKKRRNR